MSIKPWIRLVVAGASFLVGVVVTDRATEAAAGSGAAPRPSTTNSGTADVGLTHVDEASIVVYLENLGTVDPAPALAVASPRSAAWRYAEHQVAFETAAQASGLAASEDVISPRGNGRFQNCSSPVAQDCVVFGDFLADTAGLISAFTVDGVDITPRLGDPSETVTFGAVTARVRSSYRTVRSDSLVVVVSLAVESEFSGTSVAQYTDPSGRDVDQIDALAPPALPAGSMSTIALVFPAIDPGGRLTWQLSPTEAGADVVIDLEVPALLGGADHAVPPGAPAPPSIPGSTVSTTLRDLEPEVVDALNRALGTPFGASDGGFPEPEEACVNAAIAALPPSTRDVINQLASDPALFDAMNNELARVIATAYVGCVGNLALAGFLAAVQTFAVQGLDCLADTWKEILTPDAVAASLAYGHRLDDLPDAIVNELTLATAGCVPEQWWIDDETAALARAGLDNSQASCVATTIVDTFGIAPIIRRRILGFDLLPIPQSELDALEFPARCNMQFPRLGQLNAQPGACLTGFGQGTDQTHPVDCDQPHNAEVITATDLGTEFPTWPGAQTLRDHARSTCAAELEALGIDPNEYAAGWDIPLRLLWEQQLRVLTCTIIRTDNTNWTGTTHTTSG